MSYFKTKNIMGKFELSGFEGIDRSSPARDGSCTEMVNLRVLPDHSIVKRDGFRELTDFLDDIRAVLSGSFDGEFAVFAVAGNTLYRYSFAKGTQTVIGNINTQTGPVSIFCYIAKVYVIDGDEMFEVRDNKLHVTKGYAPLVGKEWGSNYPGELYEPLNILTPKGRISYIVDDKATAFLSTYYAVEAVDAVYVNGELRDASTYGLDHRLRALNVSGLEGGDRVLVYYTFAKSDKERVRLLKNPDATVFGGINNSRVFMWGGADKNRMFVSTPTSIASIEEAETVFEDSGGLYFAEENDFCVGDGKHEIKAVSRHFDRMLIFTTGETWMADSEVSSSDKFPLARINTDVGCVSVRGVGKCGNDPISIGRGYIYRWTSDTDMLEECNAYVISDKIKDLLPDDFFETATVFTDKHNGEVLFGYRTPVQSRIFVYSVATQDWYVYDGVSADHFFEGERALGFANCSKLCIFERGSSSDKLLNHTDRPIIASLTYSQNGFGHPTRKKRIAGVMGVGELKGGELKVSFESDRGIVYEVDFSGADPERVECFYKRLRSERFKNTRMKITPDTSAQQRLYSLTVTVRA